MRFENHVYFVTYFVSKSSAPSTLWIHQTAIVDPEGNGLLSWLHLQYYYSKQVYAFSLFQWIR